MFRKILAATLSFLLTCSSVLQNADFIQAVTFTAEDQNKAFSSQDLSDPENAGAVQTEDQETAAYEEPHYAEANIYEYGDPEQIIESVALGEHITGTVYMSGALVISGSGDMNDFSRSPFVNAAYIKQVVFDNLVADDAGGITSIGSNVFSGCISLSSSCVKGGSAPLEGVLVFPETITSVGRYAFSNCTDVKKIVLPDSVTTIDINVFYGCTSLEVVQLPFAGSEVNGFSSVADMFVCNGYWDNNDIDFSGYSISKIIITGGEAVPQYAFSNMTTLKEIDLSRSEMTAIRNCAFSGCTSLNAVKLPETLRSIGSYAFINCTAISALDLNDGLERIGLFAFQNCTGLTELVIPDTVTDIDHDAFNGCTSLKVLQLPFAGSGNNGISSVSDMFVCTGYWDNHDIDFSGYSISKIIITGGEAVPQYAFSNMTTLKEIDLSQSEVTSIGNYAFSNCISLSTVRLAETITSIGSGAYSGTIITALPDNGAITDIGADAFSNCTKLTDITIPSSYTFLGNGAFRSCTGITELVIPDTVTGIGNEVFNGCTSLKVLQLPFAGSGNNGISSVSDMFVCTGYWDNNDIDFSGYSISKIIITGGEAVPQYAFSNMTTLKEIDLSRSEITVIGNCAFSDCTSLNAVKLPETLRSIGSYAFINCTAISALDLNDGLERIGISAFQYCTGLTELVIPDTVTGIGTEVFNGCTSLKVLQLPFAGSGNNGISSVSDMFVCTGYWDNHDIDLSDYSISKIIITGGESVPQYAFANMKTLQEVDIFNSGIGSIGSNAFWNCDAMDLIEIPESVSHIASNAFSGFSGDVYILNPDCVIDANAFPSDDAVTIYGFSNSTAEAYADAANGYFKAIDDAMKILCPKNISLYSGSTYQIKTDLKDLTCSSSDPKIVSVNENGLIHAENPGNAVVKIESEEEVLASINVNVRAVTTTTPAVTTTPPTTTTTIPEVTTIPVTTTTSAATTTVPVTTTTTPAATTTVPVTTTTTPAATTTVPVTTTTSAVTTTTPVTTTTSAATTTTPVTTTTTPAATTTSPVTTKITPVVITTKPVTTTTTPAVITTTPVTTTTTPAVVSTKPAMTTTPAVVSTKPAMTTTPAVTTTTPSVTTAGAAVTTAPATTTEPVPPEPHRLNIDGKIRVSEMNIGEIRNAGINLTDPSNYHVFRYELKMTFDEEIIQIYNYDARPVSSHVNRVTITPDIYINNQPVIVIGHCITANEEMYMVVRDECKWLKEFYDVQLIVINRDESGEPLTNCTAKLNLPEGLTLINCEREQHFDSLEYRNPYTIHWYLRGDVAGDYDLMAGLKGWNGDESFTYSFRTENTLHVYAGDALKMKIILPRYSYYDEDYPVNIIFENVSDKPIYNLEHTVSGFRQYSKLKLNYYHHGVLMGTFDGTNNLQSGSFSPNSYHLGVLEPGDQIVAEITIHDMWKSVIEQLIDDQRVQANCIADIIDNIPYINSINNAWRIRSDYLNSIMVRHVLKCVDVVTLRGSTTNVPYEVIIKNNSRYPDAEHSAVLMQLMSVYNNIGTSADDTFGFVEFVDNFEEPGNLPGNIMRYVDYLVSILNNEASTRYTMISQHDNYCHLRRPSSGGSLRFYVVRADGTIQYAPGRRSKAQGELISDDFDIEIVEGDYTVNDDGTITLDSEAVVKVTPKKSGIRAVLRAVAENGGEDMSIPVQVVDEHECSGEFVVLDMPAEDHGAVMASFCEICGGLIECTQLPKEATAILSNGQAYQDIRGALADAEKSDEKLSLSIFGDVNIVEDVTVPEKLLLVITPDTKITLSDGCKFIAKGDVKDFSGYDYDLSGNGPIVSEPVTTTPAVTTPAAPETTAPVTTAPEAVTTTTPEPTQPAQTTTTNSDSEANEDTALPVTGYPVSFGFVAALAVLMTLAGTVIVKRNKEGE